MNLDAYHAALAALAIAEERLRTIRRLIAGADHHIDPQDPKPKYDDLLRDDESAWAVMEMIREEAGDGIDTPVP